MLVEIFFEICRFNPRVHITLHETLFLWTSAAILVAHPLSMWFHLWKEKHVNPQATFIGSVVSYLSIVLIVVQPVIRKNCDFWVVMVCFFDRGSHTVIDLEELRNKHSSNNRLMGTYRWGHWRPREEVRSGCLETWAIGCARACLEMSVNEFIPASYCQQWKVNHWWGPTQLFNCLCVFTNWRGSWHPLLSQSLCFQVIPFSSLAT